MYVQLVENVRQSLAVLLSVTKITNSILYFFYEDPLPPSLSLSLSLSVCVCVCVCVCIYIYSTI